MPGHPQRFWLAAFLFAWSVDFLFWGKSLGISWVIFIVIALLAPYVLARSEGVRPAWSFPLMALFAILAAVVNVLRAEPLTRFLNGFLAFGLVGLAITTFRLGRWPFFDVLDNLIVVMFMFVEGLTRGAKLPLLPKPEGEENGKPSFRFYLGKAAPVLRGLLIALPVVVVLATLLAAADPIFNDNLAELINFFDLARIPEYIFRLTYILILAYVLVGMFLHAVLPDREYLDRPLSKGLPQFLGLTESAVVLIAVNLLFAAFVAVQFRYLFGGQANITAAGYTYSEYARRGFFELVTVAVLSLFLSFSLGYITRRQSKGQQGLFTALSALLLALVWVILLSAFTRLMLYEDAYGFTRLRTYTHVFIPWLGLLLLATIVLQVIRRERMFGAALLVFVIGFCLTLGVMNVDGFIARQNIARFENGAELDITYLLGLSDDALPEITRAYQSHSTPAGLKDQLGAVLACRAYLFKYDSPDAPWQSYHPGMAAAQATLRPINLSKYKIEESFPFVYVGDARVYCKETNVDD